jgi:Flp pilus assembly pilin Flp
MTCQQRLQKELTMGGVLRAFLHDRRGAGGVEYGLVAAMTAVAIILAIGNLAPEFIQVFDEIGAAMQID